MSLRWPLEGNFLVFFSGRTRLSERKVARMVLCVSAPSCHWPNHNIIFSISHIIPYHGYSYYTFDIHRYLPHTFHLFTHPIAMAHDILPLQKFPTRQRCGGGFGGGPGRIISCKAHQRAINVKVLCHLLARLEIYGKLTQKLEHLLANDKTSDNIWIIYW